MKQFSLLGKLRKMFGKDPDLSFLQREAFINALGSIPTHSAGGFAAVYSPAFAVGGASYRSTNPLTVQGNDSLAGAVSVPAAQPGTLTVRTDNHTGTLTMTNSNHGIITGQHFDLYWTGGEQRGFVAGTVSGTSVPFTGVNGAGTNLPIATTAVVVGVAQECNLAFTGSNLLGFACINPSKQNGSFSFIQSSGAEDLAVLLGTGQAGGWVSGDPVNATNPFTAYTISGVWASHGDTTNAYMMTVGVVTL